VKSSIRFSINGAEFYAEGDEKEVSRKLDEFMGQVFAPLRGAIKRTQGPDWRKILGVTLKHPTLQHVERKFRLLARKHHPDKGGDRQKFEEIVQAREAARLELVS
jgi:hypothetical protein